MNRGGGLADLSVRDFVAAVASADEPVPAGGSVAALTGSSSAALLALVCEVLGRKTPGVLVQPLVAARRLQQQLLELLDEDAAAFRAFLDAERGSNARQTAGGNAAAVPLQIGRACLDVVDLARAVEPEVRGVMRLDVAVAEQLAQAAARGAVAIAEYNLRFVADAREVQRLRDDITRLRNRTS